MSSSWMLKTRQMSEAGRETLLREALATHMRSPRDRQLVSSMLGDPRPLEDILSFFGSFYLYNYQGVRLLSMAEVQELDTQKTDEVGKEERRQLELEIRQLLGDLQSQELHVARLACEFNIAICDMAGGPTGSQHDLITRVTEKVLEVVWKIPKDYSPNAVLDLVGIITGWADEWRKELYVKASGLKETSMSLRDELLREHEHEVVETSILKKLIVKTRGRFTHQTQHKEGPPLDAKALGEISSAIVDRFTRLRPNIDAFRLANELKLSVIEALELEFEAPTTIDDFERRMSDVIAEQLAQLIEANPKTVNELIGILVGIDSGEVQSALRTGGIRNPADLVTVLRHKEEARPESAPGEGRSREELEAIERSLKTLEKLEETLERPVKGMLKARGLRSEELDKITVELLTKDRRGLLGIEKQVLDELQKKTRVPSPEEVVQLIETRKMVQAGGLGDLGPTSASEMSQRRLHDETAVALKLDLVWHLMIGLLTNLTRVVETYIRSKQDLLRGKALLKTIYTEAQSEFQYLREEVLIDLMAMRIYEMKCIHPTLDAPTIVGWMHARLSSTKMSVAAEDLKTSPSPVFEGVVSSPLKLDGLEFDNYAIAYDLMHRFLRTQRREILAKEEFMLDMKREEAAAAESRKKSLDVLLFIYTKAHTVFRAISRVGTKGLEWSAADDSKCSNLLSFYVNVNRGRPVCQVCGDTPSTDACTIHGKANVTSSNDIDNISVFVMRAISDIKSGLIGPTAKPCTWEEARGIVQRVLTNLKRRGKITSKTSVRALLPGDINYVVGPAIAEVIGTYFNESLRYAARGADRG
ncbi:MAG: hypothetical protein HXY34_10155 [Candidatus Thorarchaeota archaeon]|nr:hypothetical protein [Candidatus Thorarchaeota archaeon]